MTTFVFLCLCCLLLLVHRVMLALAADSLHAAIWRDGVSTGEILYSWRMHDVIVNATTIAIGVLIGVSAWMAM